MRVGILLLFLPLAASSFGDCVCSCCAYPHPSIQQCSPTFQGSNRLASCTMCSTGFCANQYPMACPSGPNSGGAAGVGGHTSFACDGADEEFVRDAEYGGGGLAILIFLGLAILFLRNRFQSGPTVETYSSTTTNYVPMGQPAYAQPAYAQPAYAQPAYAQPGYRQGPVYMAPQPPATVIVTGGGHHGHSNYGGGHHGGGHQESRSTHTSGGF